ncbi:MAG TPA: flagellar hook capping FlgD N-terminal domain-containing protein [Candidatus Binatia bacterium]|nr:flagellar hook capping FlgD N-terminal domain-containing protein [Candidatus Binatia bacterium]
MIPPVLAATAASTAIGALSSIAQSVTGKKNDQLDRNDFLTLLVAQLQAQDPLNPMDSANFTAQLAQFSSLEKLVSIDDRLGQLTEGKATTDPVAFLGRDVAMAGGALSVTGGKADRVGYALDRAGTVTLEILDGSGQSVGSIDLGEQAAGEHTVDLASLANAPQLADGQYTVHVSVRSGAGDAHDVEADVFGRVTGVDLSSDPPVLLVGTRRVALTDIRQVLAPETA